MVNIKYAKLNDTRSAIIFAPMLPEDSTDQDYLALGWKKIVNDRPAVDESRFKVINKWYDETDSELVMQYEIIEIDTTRHVIMSKYKFIAKLMEMDLWAGVKRMLEDNGLMDLFNAAQELDSENDFFKRGIQLAKMELDLTDDQIRQFIEQVAV